MFFLVGDPFRNRSDPRLNDAVGQGSDRLLVITLFKNTILQCSKANNILHSCAGNYMSFSKNLFASQKLILGMTTWVTGMTACGTKSHSNQLLLVKLFLVIPVPIAIGRGIF